MPVRSRRDTVDICIITSCYPCLHLPPQSRLVGVVSWGHWEEVMGDDVIDTDVLGAIPYPPCMRNVSCEHAGFELICRDVHVMDTLLAQRYAGTCPWYSSACMTSIDRPRISIIIQVGGSFFPPSWQTLAVLSSLIPSEWLWSRREFLGLISFSFEHLTCFKWCFIYLFVHTAVCP